MVVMIDPGRCLFKLSLLFYVNVETFAPCRVKVEMGIPPARIGCLTELGLGEQVRWASGSGRSAGDPHPKGAKPHIARRPFACLPYSRHAGKFKARLPCGWLVLILAGG